MKTITKIILTTCISFAMVATFDSCDKDSPNKGGNDTEEPGGKPGEPSQNSLTITDIAANSAKVTVKGNAPKIKIIEAMLLSDVDFDYERPIKLTNAVKEKGVLKDGLPYVNTINGLRNKQQYITAVIYLDESGEKAFDTKYEIWTAVGEDKQWSDDGSVEGLEKVEW